MAKKSPAEEYIDARDTFGWTIPYRGGFIPLALVFMVLFLVNKTVQNGNGTLDPEEAAVQFTAFTVLGGLGVAGIGFGLECWHRSLVARGFGDVVGTEFVRVRSQVEQDKDRKKTVVGVLLLAAVITAAAAGSYVGQVK